MRNEDSWLILRVMILQTRIPFRKRRRKDVVRNHQTFWMNITVNLTIWINKSGLKTPTQSSMIIMKFHLPMLKINWRTVSTLFYQLNKGSFSPRTLKSHPLRSFSSSLINQVRNHCSQKNSILTKINNKSKNLSKIFSPNYLIFQATNLILDFFKGFNKF